MFVVKKINIVQFNNGKYAVRKMDYLFGIIPIFTEYYSAKCNGDTWTTMKFILEYCTVDTLEKAREIRDNCPEYNETRYKVIE